MSTLVRVKLDTYDRLLELKRQLLRKGKRIPSMDDLINVLIEEYKRRQVGLAIRGINGNERV